VPTCVVIFLKKWQIKPANIVPTMHIAQLKWQQFKWTTVIKFCHWENITILLLGTVAHACNPSYSGGRD
jgi:hypothetical protein